MATGYAVQKESNSMSRTIAIGNNKGGVGKTTTAINLASGLARAGKRVLLIDADPQGNSTAAVGYDEPDNIDISLATIMKMEINDMDIEPGYGILQNEEGFDLLPGNIELSELEVTLVNVMNRERIMKEYITMVSPFYDYILIDCAPSLGTITTNAFVASDSVLIPVQASYMPVKGLEQLVKQITRIKKHINPNLEIEGILMTMVNDRTNFAKEIIDMVQQSYGDNVRVFPKYIPRSVRAEESTAEGVSIFNFDPNGKVAAAYKSLTDEVLSDE
jgi:chromosome partitioning protein